MQTRRFGRKIKLPATIAIKHQMRKLAFEESLKTENNTLEREDIAPGFRKELKKLPG